MQTKYRGRFAPSPSGPLHFGSLVAAVGSYLDARANAGAWLVRIDDLDPPRVVPGAADDILSTLEACGLEWDERIVYQSTRSDAYHAALHALRQQGLVYACACSRREIADSAVSGIEGYVYPGTCRTGLPAARAARAWRVKTVAAHSAFDDRVQGRIEHDIEREIGDFVLYRTDRVYAYQLAAALDDAEAGVTDVVRGADLLHSTPRQIYLQRLLGLPTPRYAHLPVAVNERGEKLSKQTHAPAVDAARVGPALVAALRFLGQAPTAELAQARAPAILEWALANWSLARVPRMRDLPSPPPSPR
ncbi:MAG TPA: tRNA glutamyl-Q(34) synthetase GluQRS [Burkholderiales bacterium]|nr:tRNA glutamyl-Q(34) synthetase GluQRS [Burkholderiales bacterium]